MGKGDFPGGAVGKNPPANTGDTGSIPGPGRFHTPPGNRARKACKLQPLSLCAEGLCSATGDAHLSEKCAHHRGAPAGRSERKPTHQL